MADRVPEVQRRAPAALVRIFGDDASFHGDGALELVDPAERRPRQILSPQLRVVDDAVLDRLGQAGAHLGGRQGRERQRIRHDQGRRMESADQILALRQIDPGFATQARVNHGEQRRRDVDPAQAAHVSRRREASHVADHAAADRHDQAAPVETQLEEALINQAHRVERLVLLATRHDHARRVDGDQPRLRGHDVVAHNHSRSAQPARRQQVGQITQQAVAERDGVLEARRRDRQVARFEPTRDLVDGIGDAPGRGIDLLDHRVVQRRALGQQRRQLRARVALKQRPIGA